MVKYTVIQPITFSVGEKVEMNAKQYRRRIDNVKKTDVDNVYIVTRSTSFKIGEVIGYGGEVNKILLQTLEPIKKPVAPKPVEGSQKGKGK